MTVDVREGWEKPWEKPWEKEGAKNVLKWCL
jgi:hypothetical protein